MRRQAGRNAALTKARYASSIRCMPEESMKEATRMEEKQTRTDLTQSLSRAWHKAADALSALRKRLAETPAASAEDRTGAGESHANER